MAEIAFNEIQRSPRYPAGLALRFAKLKGYRSDKTPAEADTIETVRALLRGHDRGTGAVRGPARGFHIALLVPAHRRARPGGIYRLEPGTRRSSPSEIPGHVRDRKRRLRRIAVDELQGGLPVVGTV